MAKIAALIAEHGALGAALLDYYGNDIEEAREAIDDRYLGCHASLADYMQKLTEETVGIPGALRAYINYDAMARDAELSGDVICFETSAWQVHIFAAW